MNLFFFKTFQKLISPTYAFPRTSLIIYNYTYVKLGSVILIDYITQVTEESLILTCVKIASFVSLHVCLLGEEARDGRERLVRGLGLNAGYHPWNRVCIICQY